MENIDEKIAQILRDNITFSGQIGDYVIHGAIDKIIEHFRQQLKDKEAKEIRGDRMIVDLEHETVLKAQLKERDELIANLKQEIARLIEDVNKAYDH